MSHKCAGASTWLIVEDHSCPESCTSADVPTAAVKMNSAISVNQPETYFSPIETYRTKRSDERTQAQYRNRREGT